MTSSRTNQNDTPTKAGWSGERWSSIAAAIAASCNIFSWFLINFLNYEVQTRIFNRDFSAWNYPEIISQALWLMPLVAIVLLRRLFAFTLPYALVLLVIFVGSIFYFVSFIFVGFAAVATLVWPGWLLFLLGAISFCIVVIWGLARLVRHLR